MIEVTPEQLQKILPGSHAQAHVFCVPINAACAEFGIDTINEFASFLAQIGHESRDLQALVENLNYSATGLLTTWPRRFNQSTAAMYARHPEMIANRVYADRMENGDEDSGDGWRYRGRGLIQITFRKNYRLCGDALGLDLVSNPSMLLEADNAARSAGWFWKVAGLDAEDDDDDVKRETRIINGGLNGIDQRQAILDRALRVLE